MALIDLRHHIYSLVAVFFALAIGMVIGSAFTKRKPAITAEQRIIQRYVESMKTLKDDIEATAAEASQQKANAENSEEFCRALLPQIAKGWLKDDYAAVVQTGDDDELVGPIKHALELAGATVTGITQVSKDFDFGDEAQVTAALTEMGVKVADPRQAREKLFRLLAGAIRRPSSGLMSSLERAGVATFTGDYAHSAKLIVLVGGANEALPSHGDTVDSQLITGLDVEGVSIVGCENSKVKLSFVPYWHRTGIATVDNADTSMGQISMFAALTGEKANFGIKDTADRLFPRTLGER